MGNRELTPGEIDMASAIFGDSIAYGDVNIYDRGAIGLPLSITAPNGNIYYPGRFADYYSDDFSAPGVHPVARGTFMHEMGHVWQHYQGVNVALERNFNGDYDYSDKLNNNVPFDDWGIEEQAEYLSDVYRAQNGYTLGHSVNQTYTLEELLAVETAIPNLQALVASSSALTSSLRPVGRDDDQCFLFDVPISMWPTDPSIKPRADGTWDEKLILSKVWTKPIVEIAVDDLVLAYDAQGSLQPQIVTRTMQNRATHILDFWGTGVTPGHAYLCGDGEFKDQHVPLMDILRTDGAIVQDSGTLIRATTGYEVGSVQDQMIHAVVGDKQLDGSIKPRERAQIRLGTRIICDDNEHRSIYDLITASGGQVTNDGYIQISSDGLKMPFRWMHSESLPKPEDYILARSKLTLEEIYVVGEWEQIGTRMPAPAGMAGLNTNHTSTLLQPSKPEPNIPPAFASRPDAPHRPTRTLNRKQRKAQEAKQRKTTKMRKQMVN